MRVPEEAMGEKRDQTGKRVRPKTAVRGKRYLCAKCRKRSPTAVTTPAPWYCPNCLKAMSASNPE
jgi:hypothetical protein